MADSETSDTYAPRFGHGPSASERLRDVGFPLAVRGYDRRAVDDFVDEVREIVADLEAHQTREGVVQKALGELGEETAGILQRAHATADEITSRSRSEADGRLQRAEREAEGARREADEYSRQVIVDTRILWEQRQRLIEDMRQLADDVLATADDAIERVTMPEPLVDGADEDPEPTTSEEPVPGPVEQHPLERVEDQLDDMHDDATKPYRLESVQDEPADAGADEGSGESGHTVELEALPGGSDEPGTDPGPARQ